MIDSHAHYSEERPREYIGTMLRRMDECEIEKAVLFGIQGHPLCSDAGIMWAVESFPDRFLPFACSLRCEHPRDLSVFSDYVFHDQCWKGVGELYIDLGLAQE